MTPRVWLSSSPSSRPGSAAYQPGLCPHRNLSVLTITAFAGGGQGRVEPGPHAGLALGTQPRPPPASCPVWPPCPSRSLCRCARILSFLRIQGMSLKAYIFSVYIKCEHEVCTPTSQSTLLGTLGSPLGDTRAGRAEAKRPCPREAAPRRPAEAGAGTATAASVRPGALGGDSPVVPVTEAWSPARCHGGLPGLEGVRFLLRSSGQTTHFLFKEGRETPPAPNPILRAGMSLGHLLASNPTSSRLSLRAVSLATVSSSDLKF